MYASPVLFISTFWSQISTSLVWVIYAVNHPQLWWNIDYDVCYFQFDDFYMSTICSENNKPTNCTCLCHQANPLSVQNSKFIVAPLYHLKLLLTLVYIMTCCRTSPSRYLNQCWHYDDVIMTMLASQITSLMVVCSIVYSGVNQRKHQSSASLAFVREIHRGTGEFPAQMASYAENVSIWWRHHDLPLTSSSSIHPRLMFTWVLKILIQKLRLKSAQMK